MHEYTVAGGHPVVSRTQAWCNVPEMPENSGFVGPFCLTNLVSFGLSHESSRENDTRGFYPLAMGLLLGYARTSTTDQRGDIQFDTLLEAGVKEEHIYFDQLSGSKSARERPALQKLLGYARDGDTCLAYRIDRLGRSLIDVLNTVEEMQKRGIALRSLVDGIDPSTPTGRLQLGLFATLAEYERELINERVRAGIMAAKARGVRFGQKPVDQQTVEDKLEVARGLLDKGKTVEAAARTVGWSRATLYRYLQKYGTEQPPVDESRVVLGRGRSQYAHSKPLPSRD